MSATWKGTLQIVLTSDEPYFDPATGIKYTDRIWEGREDVVRGWANELEQSGIGYQIFAKNPPVFGISARIPINEPTSEVLDRYEITTEAQDKSIFEIPDIIADADTYDAGIANGADTYREIAEECARKKRATPTSTVPGFGARFERIVRNLRAGVTGFQIDFLTLRRFRQIEQSYGYASGRMNLKDGLSIYTTAQLNLPASVAFQIPDAPTNPGTDYLWGWRVRGQRVELQGNTVEQVVELVFAPWTLAAYSASSTNLNW